MRTTFTLLAAGAVLAVSLPAEMHNSPPPVIRIYREMVKPGRQAAHEKAEGSFVRAMTKANFPVHYLAMTAVTGGQEAWFIEAHDSFTSMEKADRAMEMQPLKAEMDQALALDGELLTSGKALIAVFRPDLSYQQDRADSAVPKARYFSIGIGRLKPNTEERLKTAVKTMTDAYGEAKIDQPVLVYQVISGTPGRTYLVMEPIASLAEWDKYPAREKAITQAMGEDNHKRLHAEFAEIFQDDQDMLFSLNPRMSYVSKEFAAVDPAFWNAKPMAATRSMKKETKTAQPQ